jgi:hypothetical protein
MDKFRAVDVAMYAPKRSQKVNITLPKKPKPPKKAKKKSRIRRAMERAGVLVGELYFRVSR